MKAKELTRAEEHAICKSAFEAAKRFEQNKAKRDEGSKVSTGVNCRTRNCKGKIIREISFRYSGNPMHMIIGPGSRSQMTEIEELYCEDCGITYHHLPKKKRVKK